MSQMDVKMHSFGGIQSSYPLPPAQFPRGKAGTAKNICEKAVRTGRWQNFAAGIGTGAAYASLHSLHWHPHWITIIELILFFTNVTIFIVNMILLSINILSNLRKGIDRKHWIDHSTPLVAPLIVLDYGTICIGAMWYGRKLGASEMNSFQGLFWSYLALSVIVCVPMTVVWFGWGGRQLRSFAMTGAFLFFPLMLVGTVAFNVLAVIEPTNSSAFAIWALGYLFQGLGMAVAFIFTTVHFHRAIMYGFHRGPASASTFISVGPPGFTALAALQLGSLGRKILPIHTPLPKEAVDVIYYASIPVALSFLGLALYFWGFAMYPWISTLKKQIMYNPAGAWPLTFPCTGFIVTLGLLGDIFESHGFWITQALFVGYICLTFLIILPCWFYRLLVPVDPDLLSARDKCFEEDDLDFWSSNRKAEEAELQYITASKKKGDEEGEEPMTIIIGPVDLV